jgi:hypothetical protein
LVLGLTSWVRADDLPAAVPLPVPQVSSSASPKPELDQAFLLLPSFDLEVATTGSQIRVGDSVTLMLQGDFKILPNAIRVQIPAGTEDMTTSLAIDPAVTGEDRHFTVTPVKAGRLTIPSLGIVDGSGKFIARTNPLPLDVQSAIPKDDPKPKEAEPPLPPAALGFPMWTLVVMGLVVLAIFAAGVYGIYRWSQKRRLQAEKLPKEPPKPEDEIALSSLDKLEARELLKSGKFKEHYFGISEILKHYLGSRYRFEAAESTTQELMSQLERQSYVPNDLLEMLKDMFEKLDRVKFTDYQPGVSEGVELIAHSRKIVTSTRRPPVLIAPGGTSTLEAGKVK